MNVILTKRDLLAALADVPDSADILVTDFQGNLCAPRAELNIVPGLSDATGMSTLIVGPSTRVILMPNDQIGPGWPGGSTTVLSPP